MRRCGCWRRWGWSSTRTRRGWQSARAPAAPAARTQPADVRADAALRSNPATPWAAATGTTSAASGPAAARQATRCSSPPVTATDARVRRVGACSTTSATPAEIYRQSFATIRAEADLSRFPDDVARRRGADDPHLRAGRPHRPHRIHRRRRGPRAPHWRRARRCCATRRWWPPASRAAARGQRGGVAGRRSARRRPGGPLGTTRSAAAVELWADRLGGAVLAIGNAPTALFRLLELLDDGVARAGGGARRPRRLRRLRPVQAGADRPTRAACPTWW